VDRQAQNKLVSFKVLSNNLQLGRKHLQSLHYRIRTHRLVRCTILINSNTNRNSGIVCYQEEQFWKQNDPSVGGTLTRLLAIHKKGIVLKHRALFTLSLKISQKNLSIHGGIQGRRTTSPSRLMVIPYKSEMIKKKKKTLGCFISLSFLYHNL
jgi:hypothetical protein